HSPPRSFVWMLLTQELPENRCAMAGRKPKEMRQGAIRLLRREPLAAGFTSGVHDAGCIAHAYFFFLGTLAPFLRASESPMAIACLRLSTVPPLPPLPDFSVPRFLPRIALATVFEAPWL